MRFGRSHGSLGLRDVVGHFGIKGASDILITRFMPGSKQGNGLPIVIG